MRGIPQDGQHFYDFFQQFIPMIFSFSISSATFYTEKLNYYLCMLGIDAHNTNGNVQTAAKDKLQEVWRANVHELCIQSYQQRENN
jgi:hypothetical protein